MSETHTEVQILEREAAMSRRVGHLEERLSSMRRLLLVAGVLVSFAVGALGVLTLALVRDAGGQTQAVVRAQALEIVDAAGGLRARLAAGESAEIALSLHDPTAQERMRFTVLPDGSSGMAITDRSGRPRIALGLLPDQSSHLAFADLSGVARVVLGQSQAQGGSLLFAAADGSTRGGLGSARGGEVEFFSGRSAAAVAEAAPETVPEP